MKMSDLEREKAGKNRTRLEEHHNKVRQEVIEQFKIIQMKPKETEEGVLLPQFDCNDYSVCKLKVEAYLILIDEDKVLLQTKPRHQVSESAHQEEAKEQEIEDFTRSDKKVRSLLL